MSRRCFVLYNDCGCREPNGQTLPFAFDTHDEAVDWVDDQLVVTKTFKDSLYLDISLRDHPQVFLYACSLKEESQAKYYIEIVECEFQEVKA